MLHGLGFKCQQTILQYSYVLVYFMDFTNYTSCALQFHPRWKETKSNLCPVEKSRLRFVIKDRLKEQKQTHNLPFRILMDLSKHFFIFVALVLAVIDALLVWLHIYKCVYYKLKRCPMGQRTSSNVFSRLMISDY